MSDSTSAPKLPASPISESVGLAAAQAMHAYDTGCGLWPSCKDHTLGMAKAALEAAYPAIRQQVAEEIATAIEVRQQAAGRAVAYEALAIAAKVAREVGDSRG